MKRKHLVRLGLTVGVLLLLSVGYVFGYRWSLEVDTRLGLERTVHKVWGLSIAYEESSSTFISEWRKVDASETNWVQVASGPMRGVMVKYCYTNLLNDLRRVEWILQDPNQRQALATWVLSELEAEGQICELSTHGRRVAEALRDIDIYSNHASLTEEQLKLLWMKAKSHAKPDALGPMLPTD